MYALEDLGDDDIAQGPRLEVKTGDRFRLKTVIRLAFTSQATTLYTREGVGDVYTCILCPWLGAE